MDDQAPSIWDKVDDEIPGVVSVTDLWKASREEADVETTSPPSSSKKWSKSRRLVMDGIAIVLWTYAFMKLFVFDVDRYILERLPWGDWSRYADYRWLLVICVLLLLAVFVGPLSKSALYVLLFPFIVLFWKIPKRAAKVRNPTTWVAISHAATSALSGFRWNLVASILYFLSFLAISWTDNVALLAVSAVLVIAIMIRTFYRVLRLSIGPDRFLRVNRDSIRRFVGSERFHNLMRVPDDLTAEETEKFTSEQQSRFTMKLSFGIAVQRGVLFWAHQLDRYRKSGNLYLFGLLSFIWLSTLTVLSLTLVNQAILKADASQFRGAADANLLDVVLYTINSMNVGSGSRIVPNGPWAVVVSIAAGMIAFVILGALLLNLVMTYRQTRKETSFSDAVAELRSAGASANSLLAREYDISVKEAIVRLRTIGGIFLDLAVFFTSRIPADYLDTGE